MAMSEDGVPCYDVWHGEQRRDGEENEKDGEGFVREI